MSGEWRLVFIPDEPTYLPSWAQLGEAWSIARAAFPGARVTVEAHSFIAEYSGHGHWAGVR